MANVGDRVQWAQMARIGADGSKNGSWENGCALRAIAHKVSCLNQTHPNAVFQRINRMAINRKAT